MYVHCDSVIKNVLRCLKFPSLKNVLSLIWVIFRKRALFMSYDSVRIEVLMIFKLNI